MHNLICVSFISFYSQYVAYHRYKWQKILLFCGQYENIRLLYTYLILHKISTFTNTTFCKEVTVNFLNLAQCQISSIAQVKSDNRMRKF